MIPVSKEEYKLRLEKDLMWADGIIQAQKNDPRAIVKYRDNRPIMNLKDMIESSARLYSDNVAFYTKLEKGPYTEITYKQMLQDVNGLGTALIGRGLKDKRIAIIGETNYTWSIAYLASICGTGVVVPLDKELPYEDLKYLIQRADVSAVIFDKKREPSFVQMMEEGDTPLEILISQDRKESADGIVSEWDLLEEGKKMVEEGDRNFLDAQIDSEEMSVILFTSGTTGMAKGIMLNHRNICCDLMVAPTVLYVDPSDIFFSVLPIHHTYECTCAFLMPLYKGASIAHCEGLKYITKNMAEIHPTMLLAVPAIAEALHKAIWKGIRKKGKEGTVKKAMKVSNFLRKFGIDITNKVFGEIKETLGGRMRLIIVGGAAINPQILDDLQGFGILALQGYGLSEAAPMGALNPDTAPKSNSIGVAFPGCDAKIADKGEDGIGEICIKGDNIMMGYYQNEEATNEVKKGEWLYTGDLGYMDDEGYIVITGRKKNVIITKNGKNVFPEEIEYQLSLYDEIAESMVYEGDAEGKDDVLIVASVYPDWGYLRETIGDAADDDEAVKKIIWEKIDEVNKINPGYKMIKKINLRHEELVKNTSKKVIRFSPANKEAN